jgi:hypothetical protein
MTVQLRRYGTLVRVFTDAPTPAQAVAVIDAALLQDVDGVEYYAIGAGILAGAEVAGEPEDLGPGEYDDDDIKAFLFPTDGGG